MIDHVKRPILYVDDTVEQRYAMRRILENEGFDVLEAGSGRETLALIDRNVALVVVDVRLPDINGYDLTRKIKEIKPYLPVLQVSASFSNPDLRAAGLSGGADAYIAQPVHPSELVALIVRMLRTSEAESSLRFLATIGPKITLSLSLEETVDHIKEVVVPVFADRCVIYLRRFTGQSAPLWFGSLSESATYRNEIESQATAKGSRILRPRLLTAALSTGDPGFGAIAFELDEGREYTEGDLVLASDLASRSGMALQNCILFATEQATRSALIQAEKLATAGRMSASIAHEINNPLEALTNLLYIMEQARNAPVAFRELASSALSEVTRLAHITRQSLGFYKELRVPSLFDLSRNVTDTVALYQKRLAVKSIDLTLDLEDGCIIRGIPGEIRQVISNLLVNAIEALPDKGQILVKTRKQADRVLLVIRDNGPGIQEELRARIFEPFFTTKLNTGTGLGLWITRAITEKHQGQISLTPRREGPGSEFQINLPYASESIEEAVASESIR